MAEKQLLYDMHVHMMDEKQDTDDFLGNLDKAGVYGAAVFSPPPPQYDAKQGVPFEQRLKRVLRLASEAKGRVIPLLWIHPFEQGALLKAQEAAAQGIAGFKIICNNFHVYQLESMALLREIARLGKPVCFHSGVLWDNGASGKYNRPMEFEHLLDVPKLRFSLAHCSWPWYDECIALYGKLLSAGQNPSAQGPEMFFDLTPGTPAIYRRDLLHKLLCVGYDTTHNMMFGTDCCTENYNADWTREWMERDNAIYAELDAEPNLLDQVYRRNILRFFGLLDETHTPRRLSIDGR